MSGKGNGCESCGATVADCADCGCCGNCYHVPDGFFERVTEKLWRDMRGTGPVTAERFACTGYGRNRDAAVAYADRQAAAYFGVPADDLIRHIGTAWPSIETGTGDVILFSVDVKYETVPEAT